MTQLNLFAKQPSTERRPPNLDSIRKYLRGLLRLARNAEQMPWGEAEAGKWERFFPELADELPPEEGAELKQAFSAELDRLKKAA
ncbi:MAG: hypothetical protein ACXW3D_08085 [Caulobacteraceae bacterium]